MPSLETVARIALALPRVEESTSYGNRAWNVDGARFAWHRPLRAADRTELGDGAPAGDVLGVRVADQLAKEVLCEHEAPAVFATTHFAGHDIVLIDLHVIDHDLLEDLITEAWTTCS